MSMIAVTLDKQTAKDIEQYAYMVGQTPAEVLNSAAAEYMENWYQAAERKFNQLNRPKKKTKKLQTSLEPAFTRIDTAPKFLPVAVGQSCDILSK